MLSRTVAATATAVNLGTGPFVLTSVKLRQPGATADAELYLQIFNDNAPTVGTTKPNMVLPIPAAISGMNEMSQKYPMSGNRGGYRFRTGLSYAVTTTPDGNTSAAAAKRPTVELYYEPGN